MFEKNDFESLKYNYVIDTSVLISHPESVHSLDGHSLYIPIEVLEELDSLKVRMDNVGAAARYVNRYLDKVREQGSLLSGVELSNGQKITVSLSSSLDILPRGMIDNNDNRIISVALGLSKELSKVILLSNDIALRVKCDSVGVVSEEYTLEQTSKLDDHFTGISTVIVSKKELDSLFVHGTLELEGYNFMPNEGVLLQASNTSGLAIATGPNSIRKLKYASARGFNVQGISPRSKEQAVAFELLLDAEVHMVSLVGRAGCGKTLLAVASAIQGLQNGDYEKLVISRPTQSTSKDIGFLPGTKEEKMSPWLQPIFDNLNVIFSKKSQGYFEMMMRKGIIEIEALGYVRGRTLPNTIFIIDEAQNITHHEAKAVLTRMGENSKIVLIGDLEQIDSPKVNESSSGLNSVIKRFKSFNRSGHVELMKGERSELATFAAQVM